MLAAFTTSDHGGAAVGHQWAGWVALGDGGSHVLVIHAVFSLFLLTLGCLIGRLHAHALIAGTFSDGLGELGEGLGFAK